MGLKIFKPNGKKTGHACHFQLTSSGESRGVYLEIIKQTGWNSSKKIGSFKGGDKVILKFNEFEVADLIHSIETGKRTQFFHQSNGTSSSISFSEYIAGGESKGFGLFVSKNNKKFNIGLLHSEAVALREWLKFSLHRFFQSYYAEDKKLLKNRKNAAE
jgi:hypothetical protein